MAYTWHRPVVGLVGAGLTEGELMNYKLLLVWRVKPSCKPVAIHVRTNVGRDVGSHVIGLTQITASSSIKVMQKIRVVSMTKNISSTGGS